MVYFDSGCMGVSNLANQEGVNPVLAIVMEFNNDFENELFGRR